MIERAIDGGTVGDVDGEAAGAEAGSDFRGTLAFEIEGAGWVDEISAVPSDGNGSAAGVTLARRRDGAAIQRLHIQGTQRSESYR